MTQNERINALSIDEKAEWLSELDCDKCIAGEYCNKVDAPGCFQTVKMYLESEVD